MAKATLHCSNCGRELAWKVPGEDYSICSSNYIEGFSMCHDCLIEHCMNTNCLGCKLGIYPECSFLPIKKYYMEEEKETANECPCGGDITNDCADCVYAGDYYYFNGECVRREENL